MGFVGPVRVVAAPPPFEVELGVGERQEPMHVQALVAHAAVEAFDVAVLDRLSWLVEAQLDASVGRPRIEGPTPAVAAVVEREARG